jgi:hypothetical protein
MSKRTFTTSNKLLSTLAASGLMATIATPSFASELPAKISQQSDRLGYRYHNNTVGSQTALDVKVYPGRISSIDFSQTDETVYYINLGDSSRIVYNTDFPIDSNAAQTIFLKPIQPLRFPGATTAKVTNLVVKTVDRSKRTHLYNFQLIYNRSQPSSLGVQITANDRTLDTQSSNSKRIDLGGGRTASLDDVERGLSLAISHGYTESSDPIVAKVKTFLAIARNRDKFSLIEAAKDADLDLAVVTELARVAYEPYNNSLLAR